MRKLSKLNFEPFELNFNYAVSLNEVSVLCGETAIGVARVYGMKNMF